MGYYPGWVQDDVPPSTLDWSAMSHVSHFGRYPSPTGDLTVADMQTEANHGPLVAAARAAGRTSLLCVGGGGSIGGATIGAAFAAACSTDAGRARLVRSIVAVADRFGYGGVDVDWEESVPPNADRWVRLLADLRAALGPDRVLTTAVVSGLVPGRIAVRAEPYVDAYSVMSYWSDGADQLDHYTAAGVPARKVLIGAGFSADATFADHDPAAVRRKVTGARQAGCLGVMFWQVGDLRPTATTDPRLAPLREVMMPVTYPAASWRPLGPQTQPAMRAHEVICLHTMVGYLTSTDAMFRGQGFGGTESHFGVGGRWGGDVAAGLDGAVWQWQDLDYTADANLEGNDRVISIETADNAPQRPEDIEAWTPAQLDAIVPLVAWLCRTYDIPARLVPDTRPGTRGIGYHAQGTAAVLPAGAERWSTTVGKPCPTARRIDQLIGEVIPRVQQLLDGEEDEMSAQDVADIKAAVAAVKALLDRIHQVTLANIQGKEDQLLGAVGMLQRGDDPDPATGDTHPANLTTMLSYLQQLRVNDQQQTAALATLAAQMGALAALIQQQPGGGGGGGLTAEQAHQIAAEAAAEAVDGITVTVRAEPDPAAPA